MMRQVVWGLLLALQVAPTWGICKRSDGAVPALVSQVSSCKKLTLKEEQQQTADCLQVRGDATAEPICQLLFKMRSTCASQKFWMPLGDLVACLKSERPEEISMVYPILDQLSDLPVNDKVKGAMKAFLNQMLAHMFSPGSNLTDPSWLQHAFCEARLALTYRYEYQQHLGALSGLNQVCRPRERFAPATLYATLSTTIGRQGLDLLPVFLAFVLLVLLPLAWQARRRLYSPPESVEESEGLIA
ncbi:unnamed protein product [Durusdinium trenchii]|uniref:Uncharacterized protein n=1 Tax=Durusdinium trenchii TaxID=1381693 RepID=A0ABP0L5Q7_9DINO